MKLMKFYANWCGPCKMLTPLVEEFVEQHPEVELVSINVDTEYKLVEEFNVMGIPALVVIKEEQEVARMGYMPKDKLFAKLEEHL